MKEKTHLEKLQKYYRYDAIRASRNTCEAILKDDKEERSPIKEHVHCYCYERLIENIKKGIE